MRINGLVLFLRGARVQLQRCTLHLKLGTELTLGLWSLELDTVEGT